jgi:hypothetical protein
MVGWWKRVGATAFLGGERLVVVIDDRRWFLQLRERRGWWGTNRMRKRSEGRCSLARMVAAAAAPWNLARGGGL